MIWGAVAEAVVGASLAIAGVYMLAARDRRQEWWKTNSLFPKAEERGQQSLFYRRQVYVWGPVTLIGFGLVTFVASLSSAWRRGTPVWLSIVTTAVIVAVGFGLVLAGRRWLHDAVAAFRRD